MRQPRHYGSLRQTEQAVNELAAAQPRETQAVPSSPEPEPNRLTDMEGLERRRADRDQELQERVDQGRISPGEKTYQMARWENDENVAMKQAELKEAREIAADARKQEASEQSRGRELDGPER
jgi:hypothetical protein